MSLVETQMELSNPIRDVAWMMSEFVPDPDDMCKERINRAISDDDTPAMVFWHSVSEALTV